MSAWPNTYDAVTVADTTLATTTETVVATIAGVTAPSPGVRVMLVGLAQVTAGTSTTALTARVRRGTDATGTLVGEGNPITGGVAAGSTTPVPIQVTDTPGEIANATYVLTIQQTAASANGSCVLASLRGTVN